MINAPPLPTPAGPRVNIHEEIGGSTRAEIFEAFFHWLLEHHADTLSLRDEMIPLLVIELVPGRYIKWPPTPSGNRGRHIVGVSVIEDRRPGRRRFPDDLRALVAAGKKKHEEDILGFYARLATLPHELGHLAAFWEMFHDTPAHVSRKKMNARWKPYGSEATHEEIQNLAVRLTIYFAGTIALEWPK